MITVGCSEHYLWFIYLICTASPWGIYYNYSHFRSGKLRLRELSLVPGPSVRRMWPQAHAQALGSRVLLLTVALQVSRFARSLWAWPLSPFCGLMGDRPLHQVHQALPDTSLPSARKSQHVYNHYKNVRGIFSGCAVTIRMPWADYGESGVLSRS